MKVDFVLTAEDFLEWQDLRPSQPRVPISLLLGFLLTASGYLLIRWHPDGGAFPGGVALFLGLFVAIPAAPIEYLLAFLLRRSRAKKKQSSLRSVLERFYAQPRSFEADESGWRIRVGSSEHRHPWADLYWMMDGSRILTLADSFTSYPLPKSAFRGNDLESLRKVCQQALVPASPLFSVSMTPAPRDYSSAMAAHNWHQRPATMLARYAVALVCASSVALVAADAWPPLGLLSLLLIALLMSVAERKYYQWRFRDYQQRAFQTASIWKDSICFDTGTLRATTEIRRIKYRWILEVRETKHSLMLYVNPSVFYLIPKESLQPTELAQLRQLFQIRAAKPE